MPDKLENLINKQGLLIEFLVRAIFPDEWAEKFLRVKNFEEMQKLVDEYKKSLTKK